VRTLTGHSGRVYTVAFSPDGQFLAAGNFDADHTVKVWDLKTGDVTATLNGHTAIIWSVAFSPDGTRLASGADDGVKVWDLKTGEALRTLEAKAGECWQLAFSPDGKKVVCGDQPSKTARVFNADTGELLTTLREHAAGVHTAAYSPDGKLLATGSETELVLWDAAKLELVKKIETPAGWLAFDAAGKTLLTAQHDSARPLEKAVLRGGALRPTEAQPLPPLSKRTGWPVYHLSPDGKTLFSNVVAYGLKDPGERFVRVYDAMTGKELFPSQGHTGQVWS